MDSGQLQQLFQGLKTPHLDITDKVSKNELAQLWDFNPKTISVILDTFRVE